MQQNALQQLQKVTSRWREEKEKLMEAIDQERESFEDEKAVLRRELQSVTEELTQRTTRLAAAEKELFRLRHTAVVPSTASDGGGRAVSGPSVVAHVLLRRLWFKWRQSSLLRVQAAVLCVVAALALALWAQRSDWVTSHVTAVATLVGLSSAPRLTWSAVLGVVHAPPLWVVGVAGVVLALALAWLYVLVWLSLLKRPATSRVAAVAALLGWIRGLLGAVVFAATAYLCVLLTVEVRPCAAPRVVPLRAVSHRDVVVVVSPLAPLMRVAVSWRVVGRCTCRCSATTTCAASPCGRWRTCVVPASCYRSGLALLRRRVPLTASARTRRRLCSRRRQGRRCTATSTCWTSRCTGGFPASSSPCGCCASSCTTASWAPSRRCARAPRAAPCSSRGPCS
jgi:hypothetical protein